MNISTESCSNEHLYPYPELSEEQKGRLRKQVLASDFKRVKLQEGLRKNWDKFYLRNKSNFFKDRWWTQHEFDEMLKQYVNLQGSLNFLEAGCGVGNLLFPLIRLYPHWNFYAFDFSDNAIQLLCERSKASNLPVSATVADLTCDGFSLDFPAADVVSLVFVLSAILPNKQQQAVKNIFNLLKNGGVVFVRDYAINDYAMVRFGRECKLSDRFYAKQDGTMTYYFTLEELDKLFTEQGFYVSSNTYLLRKTINRQKNLSVDRVFVQAVYTKPS